jgi:RNA polymerase sigma-70 factor (ECF subfamily)
MTHIPQVKSPNPARVSDENLIAAARNGDTRAFSSLVRRYEDTVFRFSFKICRDREKAEETLQDTFINVYRKLDSFDGKSKFSTWLYTIVTNNCLMRRRRRKSQDLEESLEAAEETPAQIPVRDRREIARTDVTPADHLLKRELQDLLDSAILALPVEYRLVFVLRDVEGKSTQETAGILHISEEATKSRLRRARAFLRSRLQPYLEKDGNRQ